MTAPFGNDTHADTILRLVANLDAISAYDGMEAVHALVAERDRERARADQAEAALIETYAEREYLYECARLRRKPRWDELDAEIRDLWLEYAALSAGSDGPTDEELELDRAGAELGWDGVTTAAERESAGSGGRETSYTCPCGYSGPEECNGCPGGCKRRPAGVTGWDHIDRAGGRETT